MCGLWFFYHLCKQMHFLSLMEMEAVLPINNNGSHLSSAVCSTSLALLVPTLRFCAIILFILSVSTLFPRLQKHCHNSCVIPASLELYLMGFTSSILQVDKLSWGKVQLFACSSHSQEKAKKTRTWTQACALSAASHTD